MSLLLFLPPQKPLFLGVLLEVFTVVSLFLPCLFWFLAALVVYCTKSRRAERYWQKTLLQMEEMESQIREEIRKGVFSKALTHSCTDTYSHTILLRYLL